MDAVPIDERDTPWTSLEDGTDGESLTVCMNERVSEGEITRFEEKVSECKKRERERGRKREREKWGGRSCYAKIVRLS